VALAAAAAFAPAGCSDPDAADLVRSARAAIAAQDVDTAKQHLKAALQEAPDHAEVALRQAMQAQDAEDQVLSEWQATSPRNRTCRACTPLATGVFPWPSTVT
jgi:hypothetical protein